MNDSYYKSIPIVSQGISLCFILLNRVISSLVLYKRGSEAKVLSVTQR